MKNKPVLKPWGVYTDMYRSMDVVFKEILIDPGCRLSLQTHQQRDEYWIVRDGQGQAHINGDKINLYKGKHVHVNRGETHRIVNNSTGLLSILEVQIGQCSEDDIVRHADDYGRTSN